MWGSAREGMSAWGHSVKAAYLDDGSIVLISAGAVERNEMPPGFVRFLTEEECEAEGISELVVSEETARAVLSNVSTFIKLRIQDW